LSERLLGIIASATDAIITVDARQRVTLFNTAAERMFRCTAAEALGAPLDRFIPERFREAHRAHVAEFDRTGATARAMGHQRPLAALRCDGVEFPIEATISQVTVGGQKLFTAIVRDVTERLSAEQALVESEERLRAVVETAVDAIITIDDRGVIETVNPSAQRMFGYPRDEMVGRNVSMLIPEPRRSDHDAYLDRYLRTGEARIIGIGREVVGLRKDGTTFPLDLSVSEFRAGGRRMFTGIVHDASNRRRLEREILEASANEQRRVGHELHDGLCQQLTGVAFATELLARRLKTEAPGAVASVYDLAREVDAAIGQARSLARGLNPVEVHAGGLAQALQHLAERVSETYGARCLFRQKGDTDVADNDAETHLFRITQEAVSNAIRHGKAQRIDIELVADAETLTLKVKDNGLGLKHDLTQGAISASSDGIGLQTMAYRARLLGGLLEVQPGPARGTVVTCSIPVSALARRPAVRSG
jgi:PAS domain S-box-containing protein